MTDLVGAIVALDAQVREALETGDESELDVLGYGEISLVVAMETEEGRLACKRLPRFDDQPTFDRYSVVFDDYLSALRRAGINVVDSRLVALPSDGSVMAYCVQPVLDSNALGPVVATGTGAVSFLHDLIEVTTSTIGPLLGLDAQISNWALVDDRLLYLDVTTPLLRDASGNERADLEIFLASLPWIFRAPVRRFLLDDILRTYYEPRRAVVDMVGNLFKEGLDAVVPDAIHTANGACDPPLTGDEVRSYYRRDARMWALLQRLRRIDRSWQRHVRHRTYPFLLPREIDR